MHSYRNLSTENDGKVDGTIIPHSRHRPISVSANTVVMAQPTVFRRRFNLKKANWKSYAVEADTLIEKIEANPENYGKLIE